VLSYLCYRELAEGVSSNRKKVTWEGEGHGIRQNGPHAQPPAAVSLADDGRLDESQAAGCQTVRRSASLCALPRGGIR